MTVRGLEKRAKSLLRSGFDDDDAVARPRDADGFGRGGGGGQIPGSR
jgi:hypothetical protein